MKVDSVITILRQLLYDLRIQRYKYAKDAIALITSEHLSGSGRLMTSLMDQYSSDQVSSTLAQLYKAIETEDWVYLADLIENVCIPAVESVTVVYPDIPKGKYVIETASSGHKTVKSAVSGTYIHSVIDPVWEAVQLANDIYDPVYRGYTVWGCGMGYFALELGKLTDGSVPVKVYDEDEELILLAEEYGCILEAKQYNVEFIHDPTASQFVKELSGHPEHGLMMHQPSIRKIGNTAVREALLKFYAHNYEAVRRFDHRLKRNYYSNMALGLEYVDKIEDHIRGKEVVVVAAGPSLDDSLDFLKASKEVEMDSNHNPKVIIAVGTVLKKLLELDIVPDYCAIIDAQLPTYGQVEGVLDCGVPMILGMAAYWRVGTDYRGAKYLALMKGMIGSAGMSEESKYLFDTGSSVTTLPIDIAMKMGAAAIYLVGTDLAYRDGMSHTVNTLQYKANETNDKMIPVESVSGGTVYTTPTLNEVRLWIEDEIVRNPDIPVYNVSRTGSLIHGAISAD